MINAVARFYTKLKEELTKMGYVELPSCNKDISRYLIPEGTESEVTYYGKPNMSIRISDHWNWYSSLYKCEDPDEIQCNNIDYPEPHERTAPGKFSNPIKGVCVALFVDGAYHTIYGQAYRDGQWCWVDANPKKIARTMFNNERRHSNA